jgi:UDP-N-acetylglucosamine transferase subunit ALG13
MIFVTIGTQIPFDRFIKAVDEIAETINETFVVQALNGKYLPRNFKTVRFFAPDDFDKIMQEARLIVSHAGTGTILSAIDYEKPIIIFPRLTSLGEHRNDHQIATAMAINEKGYTYVAYDKKQLKDLLCSRDLVPLKRKTEQPSNKILYFIINSLCKNPIFIP